MPIQEKFLETIKKYRLLDKNETVLVGVSGGPDSVTLLYLLNSIRREFNLKIIVAHLDHALRGDSRKDREFVENLASRLGLPCVTHTLGPKNNLPRGSLEEIAREERIKFFLSHAKRLKAKKIVLGHTLDDQAETVLMRLLRGTGLQGLQGIFPARDFKGAQIIRPLLFIQRKQIEAFVKKEKISFRVDKTNHEDVFTRNKIRNRLMPLLEKEYNRNIRQVLANMAEHIGADYSYLEGVLGKNVPATKLNAIRLDKALTLHPSLLRLLFRRLFSQASGQERTISFQHIKEIEDLLLNRPFHSIVDLPQGVSVVKRSKTLYFYRRKTS